MMESVWNQFTSGSDILHLVAEIVLATFVVLVFAEFIPRAIFRAKSNSLLAGTAYITDFFYQMFHPAAIALIDFSEWILKYVFNIRLDKHKEPFKRGDLKYLFQQNLMRKDRNAIPN